MYVLSDFFPLSLNQSYWLEKLSDEDKVPSKLHWHLTTKTRPVQEETGVFSSFAKAAEINQSSF